MLTASVRSNPNLPQADVISLLTTGSLSNTGTGIPTLAQGGLNTAAEILTDEIINKPIAKATDKLFGLNRFELDPIVSGQRSNATARLTVGRQINKKLARNLFYKPLTRSESGARARIPGFKSSVVCCSIRAAFADECYAKSKQF